MKAVTSVCGGVYSVDERNGSGYNGEMKAGARAAPGMGVAAGTRIALRKFENWELRVGSGCRWDTIEQFLEERREYIGRVVEDLARLQEDSTEMLRGMAYMPKRVSKKCDQVFGALAKLDIALAQLAGKKDHRRKMHRDTYMTAGKGKLI